LEYAVIHELQFVLNPQFTNKQTIAVSNAREQVEGRRTHALLLGALDAEQLVEA
jgi:hypothetical protein